jgi:hypothetical protein
MFDIYVVGDEWEYLYNEQYKQCKPGSSSAVLINVALGTVWSGSCLLLLSQTNDRIIIAAA